MTRIRRTLAALVVATGTAAASTVAAAPVSAEAGSRWAPADRATIHPGVQMYTRGAQCTGNFVFTDRRDRVYVGYAAHCAGLGEATDTNGCRAESLPLGTRVSFNQGGSLVDGGTRVGRGTLAYSSWRTMDRIGTTAPNPCDYNDFALVRVDRGDVRKVNPSVPFFGGPTGIDRDGTVEGDPVYSYGNSIVRGGQDPLSPKTGNSVGDAGAGWSHQVYTLTPGIPGDSGSAFLSEDGRAVGTLSTVALAPLPASNGLGDLAKELAFAQQHSGIAGLRMVRGTEDFTPVP